MPADVERRPGAIESPVVHFIHPPVDATHRVEVVVDERRTIDEQTAFDHIERRTQDVRRADAAAGMLQDPHAVEALGPVVQIRLVPEAMLFEAIEAPLDHRSRQRRTHASPPVVERTAINPTLYLPRWRSTSGYEGARRLSAIRMEPSPSSSNSGAGSLKKNKSAST